MFNFDYYLMNINFIKIWKQHVFLIILYFLIITQARMPIQVFLKRNILFTPS